MAGMGVQLSQVADHIPGVSEIVGANVLISDITHDSRQVDQGTLFVAIRGELHDGHDFVAAAVDGGAGAVLVDRRQPVDVPQIVVPDTRKAMAWAARAVFGMPDDSFPLAGVTGTNGKTTVTHMLASICETAGMSAGVVGTLGSWIGAIPLPTARTTPEATDLQRILATMRDAGVQVGLMEVSSHALQLHRSDAIHFSVVGFTNLSRDHLDFHGDMEAYFEVKSRLFNAEISDHGVINVGDPWGKRLRSEARLETTTVSTSGAADLRAVNVIGTSDGTQFGVRSPEATFEIALPLFGEFNVSNALVAFAMARRLGVDEPTIAAGLSAVQPIPGRMEVIPHDGPFTVVVDYAHTPDAIGVVLRSARAFTAGRIVSVIGAGGDRDIQKRAMMGAAAVRLSDVTLITTDNPRTEDPAAIANEIRRGALAQSRAIVETILDRRSAIRRGVAIAGAGDIVVILGKGHEQGQEIGSVVLPFDDRDEARDALRAQGWEPK